MIALDRKGAPIEPCMMPAPHSRQSDVDVALERAAAYLEIGGRWTARFTRYVNSWLDKALELRQANGGNN